MLVVVDIKHAFDTLPHASVLDTMCRLIVRSLPVNFVKAFLKGRHYVLRLGKHGSNEERNDVGLPQGAVLVGDALYHGLILIQLL